MLAGRMHDCSSPFGTTCHPVSDAVSSTIPSKLVQEQSAQAGAWHFEALCNDVRSAISSLPAVRLAVLCKLDGTARFVSVSVAAALRMVAGASANSNSVLQVLAFTASPGAGTTLVRPLSHLPVYIPASPHFDNCQMSSAQTRCALGPITALIAYVPRALCLRHELHSEVHAADAQGRERHKRTVPLQFRSNQGA
jgi:hypothetical protein